MSRMEHPSGIHVSLSWLRDVEFTVPVDYVMKLRGPDPALALQHVGLGVR